MSIAAPAKPPVTTESSRSHVVPPAAAVVAVLSTVAAGIHLWVVPEHREEWWAYAAFFVVVAGAQLLSAVLVLWKPRPLTLLACIAGNVGVVLLWVFSRTTGLPIGPPITDMTGGRGDPALGGYGVHAAHQVEQVGILDFTATALELVVVAALVTLLPASKRTWMINTLLVIGLALWASYLLGAVG